MVYFNSIPKGEIAKAIKERTLTYLYYQNAPLHYRFKEFVSISGNSYRGAVNFNTSQATAKYRLGSLSEAEKRCFNRDLQHYQNLLFNTYKRVRRDMMASAN